MKKLILFLLFSFATNFLLANDQKNAECARQLVSVGDTLPPKTATENAIKKSQLYRVERLKNWEIATIGMAILLAIVGLLATSGVAFVFSIAFLIATIILALNVEPTRKAIESGDTRKVNFFAILSAILAALSILLSLLFPYLIFSSILSLGIAFAISAGIFGIMALIQIKENPSQWKGNAWAWFGLSPFILLFLTLMIQFILRFIHF